MSFDPYAFLGVAVLLSLFWVLALRKKKFKEAVAVHSSLEDFRVPLTSWRVRFAQLPKVLYLFSSLFLLLALMDPHRFEPKKPGKGSSLHDPTEGRVILMALDQSGSMNESAGSTSKIELMKSVMENFVKERPQDLLGLVSFARTVTILAPPTLDHSDILKDIAALKTVSSRDQDGTAIGYAIYKTSNLIASLKEQANLLGKEAPYKIQGAVVVLVTDGLQDPNPLDKNNPYRSMELEQAADYAKQNGVKLYIINIAPELGTDKYLPNLRQMKKIAEITGGKFYHASQSSDLPNFVSDINDLEASQILESPDSSHLPTLFKRISYYPYLLALAFFLLFTGAILDETIFRRSPC